MLLSPKGNGYHLPLTWLQEPNEHDKVALLECARGVLYSLSAGDDGRIKEVHVSRIRGAFESLGNASLYRVALKLLSLFREVEALSGGYWLPAPYRVIEMEGRNAFIGATPSVHGLLGEVTCEGLGRFVSEAVAARFPKQTIESWMGLSLQPTALINTFLKSHQSNVTPTLNLANIEYLKLTADPRQIGRRFFWVKKPNAVLASGQVSICRIKNNGFYRYFSSSLTPGEMNTEAKIEQSLPRLMYAIARFSGPPVVVGVKHLKLLVEVTVPERLPLEEYRVALLLSQSMRREGHRTTYLLAPNSAPTFIDSLVRLGCELETEK